MGINVYIWGHYVNLVPYKKQSWGFLYSLSLQLLISRQMPFSPSNVFPTMLCNFLDHLQFLFSAFVFVLNNQFPNGGYLFRRLNLLNLIPTLESQDFYDRRSGSSTPQPFGVLSPNPRKNKQLAKYTAIYRGSFLDENKPFFHKKKQ